MDSLSLEQIKSLLLDPEGAVDLSDEQLDESLHALIGLSGNASDTTLLEQIKPLYRHATARLHPAMRLRNYQVMADRVIAGAVPPQALLPYLVCESDRSLVSAAALDYATLAPSVDDPPISAAEFLLDACQHGALANVPAVIGGLLLSGDRRILERLMPVCRGLNCDDVEELIQCRGRILAAGVVEFFLDWLEQLDSSKDEEIYGAVAAGLANLVLGAADETVYDIERIIPGAKDHAVNVLKQWSLVDYARIIAPRLRRLAEQERGEPVLPEVMSIWGID